MNKTSFKSKKWTKILSTLLLGSVLLSSCDCFNESEKNPQENNSQENNSQENNSQENNSQENNSQENNSQENNSQENNSQGNNSQGNDITTSTETDYVIDTKVITVNKAGDVSPKYLDVTEKTTTITKQNSEIIKSKLSYNPIEVDVSFNKETQRVEIKTDIEKLIKVFDYMYDTIVTNNYTTDVTADYSPELKLNDPKYEGKNVTVIINEKEYSIVNLKDLSDKKQESKANTTSFVIPKDAKVQLDASYINGTNNNIIDGNYGNIVVVNTKGKDAGDGFQYTSTEISISNETELVLTGNFSIPALSIENKNVSRAINMQDVTIVDTILANGADVPFPMPVTTSDLIDTFNNLLPSGQTMSPVLESHPTTLSTAFSSLPQLDLELNMENVSGDSKLKNQYINILKEYYDNDKAKLNDLDVINARDFYVNGREGKAVDDIVGLYDENNNFNNPDDQKCTTPTTLPVYDVGFLHFSDTQGVGGFQNIVVTGDQTDDMSISLDFTNVVFTGDVSGLHNNRTYKGVIHFQKNPMKDIYSEYALIKIDTPPTGKRANITGRIMDFRDIKDSLDDLTSDSDYDISNHLRLNGANKIARGYFKDETQKKYIAPKVETEAALFADTYFEPVDTELMKTLQKVEATANKSINELRELFNNHPISTEAQSTEPMAQLDAKLQNKNSEKDKVLYALLKKREYNA